MIQYLLFDLDNTLYSNPEMDLHIHQRMIAFVAKHLGVQESEAGKLRSARVPYYSTTLEWLMKEEGLQDFDAYFAAIHPEGEENCLKEDPDLRLLLEGITLPKAILTNSPADHANRVLRKIGIAECFLGVQDIKKNNLIGKPYSNSYLTTLAAYRFTLEHTLFIDDLPKYVQGFLDIGGRGILLDHHNHYKDVPMRKFTQLKELSAYLANQN